MATNIYDDELENLGQAPRVAPAQAPAPAAPPAKAPASPFETALDEVINGQQSQRETDLRRSVIQSAGQSPDRAADVKRLSDRLGVPPEIVDRDFDAIQRRAKITDTPYAQMLRESPALSAWVTESPTHAAVAHDDMENLGFLEWLMTAPGMAAAQGSAQIKLAELSNKSIFQTLTPAEQRELEDAEYASTYGGHLGAGNSWFKKALTGAANMIPMAFGASLQGLKWGSAAGVAAGSVTAAVQTGSVITAATEPLTVPAAFAGGFQAGTMTGSAKYMFTLESGLAYREFTGFRDELGRPLEPGVAKAAALAAGTINAALQLTGASILLKSVPALGRLGGSLTGNVVKQALRSPTIRAALGEMVMQYGKTLTAETAVQVGKRAVSIMAGELVKGASASVKIPGMTAPGNVDLYAQPTVQNEDGTVSTVDSVSVNVDGAEVLIPRVTPDGRHLSTEEALAEYQKTGKNLGTFESPEAANRFATQVHDDYAKGVYANGSKQKTFEQALHELMTTGEESLASFALAVLPGPVSEFIHTARAARVAEGNATFFAALGEGIGQSKLVKRLPEAAQEFIGRATKDGPVEKLYAPVETWSEYWQSKGLDPEQMATEVTGDPNAYATAIRTGEDLAIPTARYAVKLAGTEHNAFFADELRLGDPEKMNGREAREFNREIQSRMAVTQPSTAAPAEAVAGDVTAQLIAAGVEPETAAKYADLYKSAFGSLAERAALPGLDPLALYQRYGLKITRQDLEAQRAAVPDVSKSATPATERPGSLPLESGASAGPAGAGATTGTPAEGQGGEPAAPATGAGTPAEGQSPSTSPTRAPIRMTPLEMGKRTAEALGSLQAAPEDATLAGSDAAGRPGEPVEPRGGADVRGLSTEPGAPQASRDVAGGGATPDSREGGAHSVPARYAPQFVRLAEDARNNGFTGSDGELAALFNDQLAQAREISKQSSTDLEEEVGGTRSLLKAIADAGGIGIDEESANKGELETMLETLARRKSTAIIKRGKRAGQEVTLQPTQHGGIAGIPKIITRKGGHSIDTIREAISEDARWANQFDDLATFLDAVDNAIRVETGTSKAAEASGQYSPDNILENLLGVREGSAWWRTNDFGNGAGVIENNASGESAASLEAINRQAAMQARGQSFVVYDRTGARRDLIGVDAVDYHPAAGESYGIESPDGFTLLEDNGGKSPKPAAPANLLNADDITAADLNGPEVGDVTFNLSEFDQKYFDLFSQDPNAGVDVLTTGEKQPRLPGDVGAVRDAEVAQPALGEVKDEFTLTSPEETQPTQTELFQPVYHGSPHHFEEFSLHAIGSGEGNQSFGWGLYFSSAKAVAEGYRRSLSDMSAHATYVVDGLELPPGPEKHGASLIAHNNTREIRNAAAKWLKEAHDPANLGMADTAKKAGLETVEYWQRLKTFVDAHGTRDVKVKRGRLYTAEIPGDELFLDYDKPASKQTPQVQAALEKLGIKWKPLEVPTLPQALAKFRTLRIQREAASDIGTREALREGQQYAASGNKAAFETWFYKNQALFTGKGVTDPTGEKIYDQVQQRAMLEARGRVANIDARNELRNSAKAASEALNAHGIHGIRYLDGSSRSAGEGSANYVVFDPRLVTITEFDQGAKPALTADDVTAFAKDVKARAGKGVDAFNVVLDARGDLFLESLIVGRGDQRAGMGSALMRSLTDFADEHGKRIVLTPAHPGDIGPGEPTSYGRLVKFYKRFGFIENKGRRADHSISGGMYREPTVRAGAGGLELEQTKFGESAPMAPDELKGRGFDVSTPYYHQTAAANIESIMRDGFDLSKGRARLQDEQVPNGVFFKPTEKNIGVGASDVGDDVSAQIPVFLRMGNKKSFADRAELEAWGRKQDPEYGRLVDEAKAWDVEQGKAFDVLWEELRALDVRGDEREAAKLDLGLDAFMEKWGAGNVERATAARDRITDALKEAGFETVIIEHDAGSMGRGTQTVIALGENQVASAEPGRERMLFQAKERRGSIRFGADRQFNINLLERADLSTFLHETGHFYLEVFGDLADQVKSIAEDARTPAQHQLLADYDTLLEGIGATDRASVGTEHHENMARMFEAYLMKGEAPSVELSAAFSRFRAWLVGIYRSVKNLQVNLTPEVTRVFDRMVATDKAIFEQEQLGHVEPMFTSPESAGMTGTQFGLYRAAVSEASRVAREKLQTRLMSEVQREAESQWKTQRAAIAEEVTADVHTRPVFVALAAIQHGTKPDGTPLLEGVEPQPFKLDRQMIVDQFGAERLKRLPRPYVYARKGGFNPDQVAEMFGYSSGDELLTALEQAGPMKDVINAETDKRMIAEHGSILLDGTLAEKAREAVASEERESVIRAELSALGQLRRIAAPFMKAGKEALAEQAQEHQYEIRWREAEHKLMLAIEKAAGKAQIDALRADVRNLRQKARGGAATIRAAIPPEDAIRTEAQTRIGATKVRELTPNVFWSASRRAAQAAIDNAARQDFDAAIVAKQQELINLHLYREAVKAKDDVDGRVKAARELTKPEARKRLGRAGESYLDQVDGVLERFNFANVSAKALDRRAAIAKWIAEQEGEGLPVDLPEEILNDARRTPYQELTYDELVGVTDGLSQLVHLARLKNRLLKAAEARELAAVTSEVSEQIRASRAKRPVDVNRDRNPKGEKYRFLEGFFASHRKIASFVREMDGFEDNGPLFTHIVRPLDEAGTHEATMKHNATVALQKLVDDAFPGKDLGKLYDRMKVDGVGRSMSRMERIMVALNWGSESNRDRVRSYEKWTDDQVGDVLGTLSKREWDFVQGVWDHIDGYWPEIEAKQKRVFGVAPEKVDRAEVDTPFGKYAGGYFPLKYDERLSPSAASHLDLEAGIAQKQAAYVKASTRRGHTEARLKNVTQPIRYEFGVIFEHVNQVIHDLAYHETLIDIGRVLANRDVQKAIFEHYGDQVYRQFKDAIRDVAFGVLPATTPLERAFNHVRSGATIAGLAWNISTALFQPIGLTQSMVRIGPGWVARGMGHWLRDAVSMESSVKWMTEKSEFMRLRGETQQREINEIRQSIGVSTGKLSGWVDEALRTVTLDIVHKQAIADSYFFLIEKAQRMADVPTWLGQYEKSMAAGAEEATAIAHADRAVLDAQGGGQVKDLASVQRGTPMLKLWTNFYSFFNTTYNLTAESTRRTNFRDPLSVGRLAVDYALLYIIPAVLGHELRNAVSGQEDKHKGQALTRETLAYVMNTMLGFRELSGVVQGYQGYSGPAGAQIFSAVAQAASQAQQGKLDTAAWHSFNNVAGILFHYPAGQVKRTLDGLAALAEGRTHNPGVLITGPPRKEK